MTTRTLDLLKPGDTGAVIAVGGPEDVRTRLIQMGFVPGTAIDVVAAAPLGDPLEVSLRGYRLGVRKSEAALVSVGDPLPASAEPARRVAGVDGPGAAEPQRPSRSFGSYFRFHRARSRYGAAKKQAATSCHDEGGESCEHRPGEVVIALAGNPNTGKSSLFNALTGGRQHVGNWPGKTVSRVEGIREVESTTLRFVDLPGTYSLRSASPEEEAAEEFLISGEPDVIVAVVDSTNLERNLFLVLELAELGLPLIIAANMADVAARQGRPVDRATLGAELGARVVATIGRSGAGTDELIDAILAVPAHRKVALS